MSDDVVIVIVVMSHLTAIVGVLAPYVGPWLASRQPGEVPEDPEKGKVAYGRCEPQPLSMGPYQDYLANRRRPPGLTERGGSYVSGELRRPQVVVGESMNLPVDHGLYPRLVGPP